MTTLKSRFPLSVLPLGILITLLALLLPAFAQAAPSALPPRPPTPTQPPPETPTQTAPAQFPAGMASIELQVRFGSKGAWGTMTWQDLQTVVQWQDKLGDWHAVDGWRGALDEFVNGEGYKVWWVAEDDFDGGPFRWVVTDGQSDQPMAVSHSFSLPARSNEKVIVEIVLEKR
jgi:hypothetical protein